MLVRRFHVVAVPLFALLAASVLRVEPAEAASLQAVATSAWSAGNVPTYISMYIYVPDKVATNPPILVVSHYCGGTASGVFGEAQGGGIVSAADTNGFIMIYPQTTGNSVCWDVSSAATETHNGGGDSQAIAEMVQYTITKYSANANRVYATGTSSGAMMTELLLAVYPDIFKAGAEFSGVPAGCKSIFDQFCGNGSEMTAQWWGDKVRAMYSTYTGSYRPRVQLWHGTADTTINYQNQTAAVYEWTNVLGLSATPNSTSAVTLNSHQWTRNQWQSSCGYTVLDEWSETNGPHGTDANLNATYVIPFLGLDKAGATDPEIAQCGAGGAGGTGGATSTGGASSTGGAKSTGGASGTGGSKSTGGTSNAGGAKSTGGTLATGGRLGTGGVAATGGALTATGGSVGLATGGTSNTGGTPTTGGSPVSGGALGMGGSTGGNAPNTGGHSSSVNTTLATGGSGVSVGGSNELGGTSGSIAGESGVAGAGGNSSSDAGSCSCRVGSKTSPSGLLGLALGAALMIRRRQRR
jgi:poly(hydroxyalkanoate) depolymerase family esterase